MFDRIYLEKLRDWAKETDRKPLVLRGARQTGKTTLVKMFAKEFDQYIYLNLEKEEDSALFDGSNNIGNLLEAIYFLKDATKNKGRTLLFIDEIQNNAKAVATLRYLYEEAKQLYVIAAASLLESMIDNTISFPVGRVDYLPVRPCTFEEFLVATREVKSLQIIQNIHIADYAHDKLMQLFKTYTIIGGMPEIIHDYSKNKDLGRLTNIYNRLLISYLDDIEKYAGNKTRARAVGHILKTAFRYAGSRITFEKFGGSTYRSREMGEAFRTLEKAMLLQLTYPVTKTRLPLEEKLKMSPKLFMLDTGMVNHSAGLQKQLLMSKRIDENYNGKIAEHITAQQLLAQMPSVISKLNFWVPKNLNAQAEIDFVLPYGDMLIPIEVKSGSTGKLRSLHSFLDKAPHSWAIRVYAGEYKLEEAKTIHGKSFKLINLPFYLLGQIHEIMKRNIG